MMGCSIPRQEYQHLGTGFMAGLEDLGALSQLSMTEPNRSWQGSASHSSHRYRSDGSSPAAAGTWSASDPQMLPTAPKKLLAGRGQNSTGLSSLSACCPRIPPG